LQLKGSKTSTGDLPAAGFKPGYQAMDAAYVSAGAPKKYEASPNEAQTFTVSSGDIGMLKSLIITGPPSPCPHPP